MLGLLLIPQQRFMVIRIKKIYLKSLGVILLIGAISFLFGSTNHITLANKANLNSTEITKISPNYYEYSDASLEQALKKGDVLLFFAATSWCNSCSALHEEIIKKSDILPDNLTLLKIDYDNDKESNKKYFVTLQHTLILLDKKGDEKTRWVGGDFNNLLKRL